MIKGNLSYFTQAGRTSWGSFDLESQTFDHTSGYSFIVLRRTITRVTEWTRDWCVINVFENTSLLTELEDVKFDLAIVDGVDFFRCGNTVLNKHETSGEFVNRARRKGSLCDFGEPELVEGIIELIIASTPHELLQKHLLDQDKGHSLGHILTETRKYEAIAAGKQSLQSPKIRYVTLTPRHDPWSAEIPASPAREGMMGFTTIYPTRRSWSVCRVCVYTRAGQEYFVLKYICT